MTASSAGPDAVQQLIDRQAIVDVIHAYCRNVDLVRPAEIAALFTEDCVVDYGPGLGPPTGGSAELERRLATGLPRFAATSHHVSNIEVDVDDGGDAATTITYLYAWHRYDDGRPDAHLWARYHDRFVRTAAGWRIAERTLRVAGQQDFDVEWHPIGRAT
jgi:ketosteroid isomerase-like protein